MLGLKLLLALLVVVNHTETLRRSTTELGLQAENNDSCLLSLVQRGELLSELISGQVGAGGVENSEDKLLAVKQSVGDELGGSEGDWAGGILRLVEHFAPLPPTQPQHHASLNPTAVSLSSILYVFFVGRLPPL